MTITALLIRKYIQFRFAQQYMLQMLEKNLQIILWDLDQAVGLWFFAGDKTYKNSIYISCPFYFICIWNILPYHIFYKLLPVFI